MIKIHARPPPSTAISQEEMHANTMTAALWYQSGTHANRLETERTTDIHDVEPLTSVELVR